MIFLTGNPHSGKTGLILDLVRRVNAEGLMVAGIACPGLWQNEMRAGFELLELDTGRQSLLSRRVPGLKPIPYMFDAQSVEKGEQALSASRCQDADLVVVDEVGKLELLGWGWARSLLQLLRLEPLTHLWVVRTSLVNPVQAHFGVQALIINVQDTKCLDRLFEHITMQIRSAHV